MISDRPKAVAYYAGAALICAATAPLVPLAVGIQPFNERHWEALGRFIWSNGLPAELAQQAAIYGGIWLAAAVVLIVLNPWSMAEPSPLGDAAWAKPSEYLRWKQPRLTARAGVVLGRKGRRLLISDDTTSTAVVAPAGTGKTRGVVIPTILAADRDSLIVNDPKGELYTLTAGHRATLGPVYRIEYKAGAEASACFNPLDPAVMPDNDPAIGDRIDNLVQILVPGQEGSFWKEAPEAGLAACTLFHFYECRRTGTMPTLRGVLEWSANLQLVDQEEGDDPIYDPIGYNLDRAAGVAEIEGYPARVAIGLRKFAALDVKTRSNVTATFDAALRILLNDNVAAVTSRTDFRWEELRGVNGKPVTVYIVVPALEQATYGKMTGILIESALAALTQREPDRRELTVRMILDEAAFLPPSRSLIQAPAVTRSFRVAFLFAFQDYAQIRASWREGGLANLKTNTALKVVLTVNDFGTARDISSAIGNFTRRRKAQSRQRLELGKGLLGRGSTNESEESIPLVRPEEIMSLKFGRQIIQAQGQGKRPIMCRSAFYDQIGWLRRRSKKPPPPLRNHG